MPCCNHCMIPGEGCAYPVYGPAPHVHEPLYGGTVILPHSEWPANFREDPETPGAGIYWCPECGHGKPSIILDAVRLYFHPITALIRKLRR